MKFNFLFPNRYKKIGWFILIPSSLIGLLCLIFEYEPTILDFKIPAILIDGFLEKTAFFKIITNNLLNEIAGVLVIISSLMVAFSKEKIEDEFISKIRLECLLWAIYANYGILLFAFLFIYDFSFFWVMVLNMFTVLFFFIFRFNRQLSKLKKS